MTFTEATSSGRDFRRVGGSTVFFWLGSEDDRELMERVCDVTHQEPKLTWRDYFKTEFEFVEVEAIEVGDTVRYGESSSQDWVVVWLRKDCVNVLIQYKDNIPTEATKQRLTLIRKGNVHTFKGVAPGDMDIEGGTVGIAITAYHSTVWGKMIKEIQESDKLYDITFKEVSDV